MALKIAPPEPDTGKRRRELRALWRLCAWGGTAATALTAVAVIAQTDIGAARLQLAFANATEPVRSVAAAKVPQRAIVDDDETRRLASQVRDLTADRDRLAARLASLEHHLDDMTSSIKRQVAQAAAVAAAAPPLPAPSVPIAAAPVHSPPANAPSANTPPPNTPLAKADTTDNAAPLADKPGLRSSGVVPESVPLPPSRIAAVPPLEPAVEPPPPAKPEFGVALAGATSLEVMRLQWAAVKANFGPLLAGLHPRALQERRNGASHYRLVLGPLPDHTAAAKLCGRLIAARAVCNPAKFVGEPL